jgi:hypothetical protein
MERGVSDSNPPVRIALPEPIGRRSRLGPFASGADALKFALWAALGALVASATQPIVWLPFLAGGFWVAAHRVDGRTADERLLAYVRWRFRPSASSRTAARVGLSSASPVPRMAARRDVLRLSSGRYIAVLRTGGIPVTYLPRPDAERLFETYRTLLRATDNGLGLWAGVEPFPTRPFLPAGGRVGSDEEGDARAGYAELIRLLAHRRYRRRVFVILSAPPSDAGSALPALRALAGAWVDALRSIDVPCERLRGASLEAARRSFGWTYVGGSLG